MQTYKCEVVDIGDPSQRGSFKVNLFGDHVDVIYTTPYLDNQGEGGFVATPQIGAMVLILQPDNSDEYFYLSTIAGDTTNPGRVLPEEDKVYEARGVPMQLGFYSSKGHKLVMSDSYNPKYFNLKMSIKSHLGKQVTLNDSPDIDAIYIKNEHWDGIKIQTGPSLMSGARSIEVMSQGPQQYICKESEMDLLVYDGRELNIKNESTGFNRARSAPEKYGNINLESLHRDVNVTTRSEDGRIFIDALGIVGLIQIDTGGKITINSDTGDINLNAPLGNVNINAGKQINLQAGTGINLNSLGEFKALSLGPARVQGLETTIHSLALTKIGSIGSIIISPDGAAGQSFMVPITNPIPTPPAIPIPPLVIEKEENYNGD